MAIHRYLHLSGQERFREIDTLDNPGWTVEIDLTATDADLNALPAAEDHRTDDDWIICSVDNQTFKGAGGPENLDELLSYFLDRVHG